MEYWFKGIWSEDYCKYLQKKFNGVTAYDIHVKYSKNADGLCTLCIVSNAKNEEENMAARNMFAEIMLRDRVKRVFDRWKQQEKNK